MSQFGRMDQQLQQGRSDGVVPGGGEPERPEVQGEQQADLRSVQTTSLITGQFKPDLGSVFAMLN